MGFWESVFGGSANTGSEGNEGNEGDENNEADESNEGNEGNEGNVIDDVISFGSNAWGNITGGFHLVGGLIGDHDGDEGNEGGSGSNADHLGKVPGKANIVVSEYNVIQGACHLTITFYDSEGNKEVEINGLATTADGQVQSIGLPLDGSDIIKVFSDGTEQFDVENNPNYSSHHNVWSGSDEEMQQKLQDARVAGDKINAQKPGYQLLDQNSNSVANTILSEIGLDLPLTNRFAPGDGNNLLSGSNDGVDSNSSFLNGSSDDDVLGGNDGEDLIYGLFGAGKLSGSGGADILSGGDGNDEIRGDAGGVRFPEATAMTRSMAGLVTTALQPMPATAPSMSGRDIIPVIPP